MKFILLNAEGRQLASFASLQEFVSDLVYRAPFLEDGDQVVVRDDRDDRLLHDIISQSKKH